MLVATVGTESMTYQLAIFDFDGTLADSFDFFIKAHNSLAQRHGFAQIDLARIDHYRGQEPRQLMRSHGVPMWKLPFIARDFIAMMSRDAAGIRLFDGIAEVLHSLSVGNVALAIVTSNSLENVTNVVGSELMKHFRHIEAGASMFGKRRRIERVLTATGVQRHDAIYIGDQATDAQAANAAGVAFGAVRWGYALPTVLDRHSPAMTFHDVSDLRRIARGT